MKTRTTKRLVTTIASRDDLETALGKYAAAVIEGDALQAEIDEKVNALRAGYEERAAEIGARTERLYADIQNYIALNPSEIPAGRKSLELLHGIVGYRLGNPAVKCDCKEADMVEKLLAAGKKEYLSTSTKLDKPAILAAEGDEAAALRALGISIKQTEGFYIEIKREQPGV
jgi:phage host-nuclease inhibitor protein Gam